MSKLNITKGEWKINEDFDIITETGFQIAEIPSTQVDLNWAEKGLRHWSEEGKNGFVDLSDEEHAANAVLVADAGTTYNKCGELPSELLQQRDELLKALKQATARIKFMEQYTEGKLDPYSKADDWNFLIQKIENPNP